MTRQDNYTMTEAEAMQAARENMVYLEQFACLVWNLSDKMSFAEARKKAIKVAEEKGDEFMHYPQAQKEYPTETMLAYCFPELTEKNIAAVLKWKRKRDRARMRSKGRRGVKSAIRIFGEAWSLTGRFMAFPEKGIIQQDRDEEEWTESDRKAAAKYNIISSVFHRMINIRYSGRRFILPTMATYRPRTSSRSPRRSPVRSAAKSGGDDNGEGDSDGPGEPPRPVLTVPSLQTSSTLTPPQRNSFSHSRIVHPCRWSLGWRWAA